MKKYIHPEIEMIEMDESDIIATSGPDKAYNVLSNEEDMAKDRSTDFSDEESIW